MCNYNFILSLKIGAIQFRKKVCNHQEIVFKFCIVECLILFD